MKKFILITTLFAVAATAVFLIFKFKPSKQMIDEETTLTSRDLYFELREDGFVTPRNRLEIKPSFNGRIEKILVNEGDKIKKGQIIILMSSSERASMIDMARTISEQEYERWQDIYKPIPIIAYMDGFIISRQKEPGQIASPNEAILVMADDLIVKAYIDETNLRYIKKGIRSKMYLDAYPDENFEGIVEHISYESKNFNNVNVYEIRIKLLKKPKSFKSGMLVTIKIIVESKKNAPSIGNTFISEIGDNKTVTVKTGNINKPIFEKREIKTGISDGIFTEILSGLDQDETVVIFKPVKKKN
ncbi:MAG: efflux RND transporter periplasmic adaptor subunit [Endomicrobium sp.]|jgi:macrolide-specific efflux system membrane fusion protein|nr:efflux RND transporter periplasmic adaptor subunit [Endomicrobium sp.]